MSRPLLFFLLLGISTLFLFPSLCSASYSLDSFWADDGESLTTTTERLVDEAQDNGELNIQKEMLHRMADEQADESSTTELVSRGAAPLTHVMLQAFDTDGDGLLSAEERSKIDKKAWLEFHNSMKGKALTALNNAIPTLKEMKMRLQQARFGGSELPKDLFNKQKLQEKMDEHLRMAARPTVDPHPAITVAPGASDLHKRSLEHARRYAERQQQSK